MKVPKHSVEVTRRILLILEKIKEVETEIK